MPTTPGSATTTSRSEALSRLRAVFVGLTDEENCMCKVAAERGIFCKGFSQFSDEQLRDRYWWIVRRQPDITREQLESVANDWQLAQQQVRELPVACDVQAKVHDTCRGWNDFTDEQLAGAFLQVLGENVRIV